MSSQLTKYTLRYKLEQWRLPAILKYYKNTKAKTIMIKLVLNKLRHNMGYTFMVR